MSDDQCDHVWGEPEEVELAGMGVVHSPLCKHCGAVKLEVGRQAAERRRMAWLEREAIAPAVVNSRREAFDNAEAAEQLPPLGSLQMGQGRLAL